MADREALPPVLRVPGPIQTLWYTFDQPGFFAHCRDRFGPTWSVGLPGFPPVVVTSDRDAIKRLFTGDPLVRRHGNDLLRRVVGDRSLMLLEPAEHLSRRKLELPAFHGEAVRRYEARIRELIETELATWQPGALVRTAERARAVTLAVILELVLGVQEPELRTRLGRYFGALNNQRNNLALFLPERITRRTRLSQWIYAPLDGANELLAEHIATTRQDPALAERQDVLAVLARAPDGLSDEDLRAELLTLVLAGHETTATAMAWASDLLAHHPRVVDRLRDADDGAYVKATAKEVLRVRTVVYASAGRFVLEPFTIGKWAIDPDTLILVDAQGVHWNPALYPQPHCFRPERFLEQAPDSYAYIPFGGGAHRCLGAALATLELELYVDALAQHVELAPVGPPARPVRRNVTLAPANGGEVRVAGMREPAFVAA